MIDPIQAIVSQIRDHLTERFEITVDGETYQVREIFDHQEWNERTRQLQQHDWTFHPGEFVFSEDSSGNFFTIGSDDSISFLDHETDERTLLCQTLKEFSLRLKEPEEVELPPHKVINVWVDPDFKPEFD